LAPRFGFWRGIIRSYREFAIVSFDPLTFSSASETLPPIADVYNKVPDRWQLQQPEYRRYAANGEYL